MRTLTDSPVFCAICGCSLESGHLTGSSAPHALRERRQFVRHKRVAVERGEPDSCAGERYVVDGEEWDTSTEWPNDYEPEGYNPTLVSRESLEWLAESCCLAINEGAEAGSRWPQSSLALSATIRTHS
ncbi:hypothetical protein N658DRAFT_359277 [Parathielavia hyrcaniae]|uniref:Uncharacterized protein n=1 Tax=Parathielavia hyrcaniae TaxID=113614 RepID=A0AAN6Q2G9_9PEZI|nr:hypothetical protein N658DRAFT_359277 [Parathielavia hyrcaniae]